MTYGSEGPGLTPWVEVAASAYRAYAASTGNKNFQGNPMPGWADLPQKIRTAWEAAARQVGDVLKVGSISPDAEQSWTGWVPPHLNHENEHA